MLTKEQVLALAPDDASAKAGAVLASDGKWVSLGADAEAAWGECKGSGAKPYQTQVDLSAMAARCSCPSRKFPCKHGLGLLLLYVQRVPRFANAERPAWVNEWIGSRKQRAAKKEAPTSEKAPQDPAAAAAAAAKSEAARWKRIEAGAIELQRWIVDQFRNGLGRFSAEQRGEWSAMAARMVDAQAPGLAQQLSDALEIVSAGATRYEEAAGRLGLMQLLIDGVIRRESLSPQRRADLRTALGWPHDKEEVAAAGESVNDEWLVIGQITVTRDERLAERRVWLRGKDSGRDALLLDFAFKGKAWDDHWLDGASYRALLTFYPGTLPLRALARNATKMPDRPWPADAASEAVERASIRLAGNPWLRQVPMLLRDATPMVADDGLTLQTTAGAFALRLKDAGAWSLLAFSGGHPVHVMGEWDGAGVLPLTAQAPDGARGRWILDREHAPA